MEVCEICGIETDRIETRGKVSIKLGHTTDQHDLLIEELQKLVDEVESEMLKRDLISTEYMLAETPEERIAIIEKIAQERGWE